MPLFHSLKNILLKKKKKTEKNKERRKGLRVQGHLYCCALHVQELSDMEMRLRNGGLGGVQNYAEWEAKLMAATDISTMVSSLLTSPQW